MRLVPVLLAVITSLTVSVRSQTVENIYKFPAAGLLGEYPVASLTVGPGGDLYGTTYKGGPANNGTAFRISTAGAFTSLGNFDVATTGQFPYARLVNIGDGFLYGATERNGNVSGQPFGTVFRLDPAGSISVVFQMPGSGTTPKIPHALVSVEDGVLHALGSSPGGFWRVPLNGDTATSFDLSAATVGSFPNNALLGNDGNLYGTCEGTSSVGTDPNLRGTIWRVAPNGTGLVKLHDCEQAGGTNPHGGMVLASDGNFYGTMRYGGINSYGVIFRITPAGEYTVIRHLDALTQALGDLIQASDGNIYGTARGGGQFGYGGVFRVTTSGNFTVIHSFKNTDGASPEGGLVQASDGHLYGTTAFGGDSDKGTIFRVRLNLPPPNRPPVALNDVGVIGIGAPGTVAINVLANDFDPEGGALTVTNVSMPAHGTAVIFGDNTIVYDPDNTYAGSDTFNYTVRDPQGATATSYVVIQSEPVGDPVIPGSYNGILYLDPDLDGAEITPRAQIFLKVNLFGKVTGALVNQRKVLPFRGSFDLADGTAFTTVKIPGAGKAILFLAFLPGSVNDVFAAVIGRETWSGSAAAVRASDSPLKITHTVSVGLEATPGLPAGFGYGLMKIKPNGIVTCVGRLGDGTPLAWGSTLVSTHDDTPLLPVFCEPKKGGVFAGRYIPLLSVDYDFAGTFRWIRAASANPAKPYAAGFFGLTVSTTNQFTPQPALDTVLDLGGDGTGTVLLDHPSLASILSGGFTFSGKKAIPALPLKSLVINRKTGLVTGKLKDGAANLNFSGVIDQRNNNATGQFFINGESGPMVIEP